MTLRTMIAALAGLALAACNGHDLDDGATDTDDSHSGSNDTIDKDPFAGDDQVELEFAPDFGGIIDAECDVELTCANGDVTKTTSGSSNSVFIVDRGAECTYSLGARGICENANLCHRSADGRLWTKSGDLGAVTESQEVTAVANWYFETPELRCSFNDREVTALDIFVDEQGTFEIESIASDGSWFVVLGDSFDYAGREAERGWSVTDLTINANSADFTVDMVSATFDVDCTW